MSALTWRLADLFGKQAFLLKGLGWGSMPLHAVDEDLAQGRLVRLPVPDVPEGRFSMAMSAVYGTATPPRPAGRWLIKRLKACIHAVATGKSVDRG